MSDGGLTGEVRTSRAMPMDLAPLVKWIGGKRKLAPQIVERLPAAIEGTYFEPFVGAGAVFCALWNAGRIRGGVVLADHNRDLIALYGQVRDEPQTLLSELRAYEDQYRSGNAEALYYRVRDEWNADDHTPSRFVFLKQTAFNGLWRVNKQGKLNAAWGKYEDPNILDVPNILAWHEALRQVSLFQGDTLAWRMPKPTRGDVVYLDPPYVGTFDGYTDEGFSDEQQDRLLSMASEWTAAGAHVAYSNSSEAEERVRRLWPSASVEFFTTSYTVNRDPNGRKGKRELFARSQEHIVSEAPAVVVPTPEPRDYDIAISPSQVETFDLCKRKWAYQKIDRLPSTQNAAAALGEEAHKHRENWLIHGIPPPDSKAGNLARVGLEHLPPPGKVQVEIPLILPVVLDADPSVNGGLPPRVRVNGRIDFYSPNDADGAVFGERGVPLIGDHKTTSGVQWAKTEDDLLNKDSQSAIYAAYALSRSPQAPAVDLHWSYMVKASSPQQHQVRVRMTRDHALTRFSSVVSRAKDMLRVIQTPGIVASAVEPTVSACEAFGGCPYREICPISDNERIGALMAQGSLNDLLSARLSAAPAAPAAPATPVAAPAPAAGLDALNGLLGGRTVAAPAPAAPLAAGPSDPGAMAALFGTAAPAPTPIVAAAPLAPAPAPTAPANGGGIGGLFGALGATSAPPVAAPVATGIALGSRPIAPPAGVQAAPAPALVLAPVAPVVAVPAPVAPAPILTVVAPPPATSVLALAPAAPATGVVPPDAPTSDPALTLEDVKAMEAGTGPKKRGRPKKAEETTTVAAPATTLGGDDAMLAVLTRIAVALEALVTKG